MKHWPHDVKSYTPSEVRTYAVEDPAWQSFRESLHGLSTEQKLQKLHGWLHLSPDVPRRRQVQVDNYINALKRGGQLSKEGHVQR